MATPTTDPTSMPLDIRAATPADFPHIQRIECADAAREGGPAPEPNALREYWFGSAIHPYVAEQDGEVIAVFRVRPIRDGEGAHVAHASFVVEPAHRGNGVGSRMAERAVDEAHRLGFRAMQFGFVPCTRAGSVALWQRLGFAIVGTLPGCYRDPGRGDVDAYVLPRELGRA